MDWGSDAHDVNVTQKCVRSFNSPNWQQRKSWLTKLSSLPFAGKDNTTANKECEFFEVYTSPSEPGVLSWVEDWNASVEWLLEEHKKDYFKKYITATEPMFLKPRETKLLQRAGLHLLVSRVASTNKA
ncbi:hypothetical protein QBC46DRAFT_354122 [Diplogelasinospora grovesii]|uniref:Uncharacterized protein n=1 Tax=Diplogelasinospora grovesii TaxID=303347 RepID=A0AAN6N776_9PEZI|nr:hypothetical protein QBC46DRAFT_354122 [Diplogelasinospora grovesii]